MSRFPLAIFCIVLAGSCAHRPAESGPALQVQGLRIENRSESWVSAARLLVPVSGGFVSCGNIPPGSRCSTTFPATDYSGDTVEVTWSQGGQIHSTGPFAITVPDDLDESKPVSVVVVITAAGSAGAMIIQSR